jgi:hypothetical protein
MESTNTNLSQTNLSQSNLLSSQSSFQSSSSEGGFFDSFKNINATTWILIILILAFLGFNIFVYLAKGTQDITNFFSPILKKLFGGAVMVTGEAVDVSAEGAKAVVAGTAGVLEKGLTAVQDITPQGAQSSVKGQSINQQQQPPDIMQQSTLNKALNSSSQSQQDYQANEASSSVHNSSGKAGWCFVGVDRGFRTCAEVGVNDTCMSGEIFPSQEICMNPNLRA